MLCPNSTYGVVDSAAIERATASTSVPMSTYGRSRRRVSRPGSWMGQTSTSGPNALVQDEYMEAPRPAYGKQYIRSRGLAIRRGISKKDEEAITDLPARRFVSRLLPEASRRHVGPHLANEREALLLGAALPAVLSSSFATTLP